MVPKLAPKLVLNTIPKEVALKESKTVTKMVLKTTPKMVLKTTPKMVLKTTPKMVLKTTPKMANSRKVQTWEAVYRRGLDQNYVGWQLVSQSSRFKNRFQPRLLTLVSALISSCLIASYLLFI